jgi:hypothetical protein
MAERSSRHSSRSHHSSGSRHSSRSMTRSDSDDSYRSGASDRDHRIALNVEGGTRSGSLGYIDLPRRRRTGTLHHVRKPDRDSGYAYEHRLDHYVSSQTSYGRSELAPLSSSNRVRADLVLRRYGESPSNLPGDGENCQNWVHGEMRTLERKGFASPGTAEYYRGHIGGHPPRSGRRCRRMGDLGSKGRGSSTRPQRMRHMADDHRRSDQPDGSKSRLSSTCLVVRRGVDPISAISPILETSC